jgi:hypothetical protein
MALSTSGFRAVSLTVRPLDVYDLSGQLYPWQCDKSTVIPAWPGMSIGGLGALGSSRARQGERRRAEHKRCPDGAHGVHWRGPHDPVNESRMSQPPEPDPPPGPLPPTPDREPPNRRIAMMAILVIIVIGIAGWWISTELRHASSIQDCVMQGRRNCAPVNR